MFSYIAVAIATILCIAFIIAGTRTRSRPLRRIVFFVLAVLFLLVALFMLPVEITPT